MKLIDIKNRSNIYYQVVSQSSAQVIYHVSSPIANHFQSLCDLQIMSLERVRVLSQVDSKIADQVNETK